MHISGKKSIEITSKNKMPLCENQLNKVKGVLSEIDSARKAIQYKHKIIKFGRETAEQSANELFKPIVTPLNKLVGNSSDKLIPPFSDKQQNENQLKKIYDSESESEDDFKSTITDTADLDRTINDHHSTLHPGEDDAISVEIHDAISPKINDENINSISLPSSVSDYLQIINSSDWDRAYGVRKLRDEYKIGDSIISISDSEIKVGDTKYPCTPGLMELLFKRIVNQDQVTDNDVAAYRKIILTTNAHCKHYTTFGAIRDPKSQKYLRYISKFQPLHSGKGLIPKYKTARKIKRPIDYVYWNDPNELVDRLRLLTAARSAGNTNHSNEILSIIEELREANIIY